MKKIFWRVFVAFGAVLLFFTILIGLMFTRFNRTNIVGAYKQQLGDLADGVVTRTSQAVKDHESDDFMDYLRAMEDFGKMQNVDIWIVADESSKHKLSDTYTNVQMEGLDIPKETENIIKAAFRGKRKVTAITMKFTRRLCFIWQCRSVIRVVTCQERLSYQDRWKCRKIL